MNITAQAWNQGNKILHHYYMSNNFELFKNVKFGYKIIMKTTVLFREVQVTDYLITM
jgi:hypothetical protein